MHSLSSKGSTFTVSTGGKTFVAPHVPLGVATYGLMYHFIPPVPPIYVSEYQDKYKWPAVITQRSKTIPLYGMPKDVTVALPRHNQWQRLLNVVDALLRKGYDTNLLRSVRQQVAARRFDSLLEFATSHFRDVVGAEQPQLDAQVETNGDRNGKESVATSANIVSLPEDLLSLCKEFLSCVEAIKAA